MRYRHPGFLKSFGARLGAGLADELLDRWFPQPPSFLERLREACIEAVPAAVEILAKMDFGPKPTPADVARAIAPETMPPSGVALSPTGKVLGEFTCPKCAGHTWSTMGFDENGTYLRYCTNGLETAYGPGTDPNTVKEPCKFQWKATEDHLYFAKPSTDEARRATDTQTCAPPDNFHASPGRSCSNAGTCLEDVVYFDGKVLGSTRFYALLDESSLDDAGKRLKIKSAAERIGVAVDANPIERYRSPLQVAVGDRTRPGESHADAAARLLGEADAFIKQQSDKIADLMLDNVFPAGKGEVGFMLTEEIAKKIGLRYAAGAAPIRVSLVLDAGQWAVRLGLGRVGGELVKVDWDVAESILRSARPAAACGDQTAMAQNAAGGVA